MILEYYYHIIDVFDKLKSLVFNLRWLRDLHEKKKEKEHLQANNDWWISIFEWEKNVWESFWYFFLCFWIRNPRNVSKDKLTVLLLTNYI